MYEQKMESPGPPKLPTHPAPLRQTTGFCLLCPNLGFLFPFTDGWFFSAYLKDGRKIKRNIDFYISSTNTRLSTQSNRLLSCLMASLLCL